MHLILLVDIKHERCMTHDRQFHILLLSVSNYHNLGLGITLSDSWKEGSKYYTDAVPLHRWWLGLINQCD